MDLINDYLNETCSHIKNKQAHLEVREELKSHIQELTIYYTKMGYSSREATKKAIESLGDSSILGNKLNQVHKGSFDFKNIILMGFLVLLGFIGTFTFNSFIANGLITNKATYSSILNITALHSVIWIILGALAFLIGSKINFIKLKKFYIPFYIYGLATASFTALAPALSRDTSSPLFFFLELVLIPSIAPFLFFIALSTLYEKFKFDSLKNSLILIFLGILPLPFLSCSFKNTTLFICYGLSLLVILYVNTKNIKILLLTFFFEILLFLIFDLPIITSFAAKFFSNATYVNSNYNLLHKLLTTSNLIGKNPHVNPFINMYYPIASAIGYFGYIFGIVIILGLIYFGFRLIKLSLSIKNTYGKSIAFGISTMICIQIIFSLLVNLNILPFMYTSTPFISSGGFSFVILLFMLGFFNRIYKYKSLTLLDK